MPVATELFRRLTQENTYVQEFKAWLGNSETQNVNKQTYVL